MERTPHTYQLDKICDFINTFTQKYSAFNHDVEWKWGEITDGHRKNGEYYEEYVGYVKVSRQICECSSDVIDQYFDQLIERLFVEFPKHMFEHLSNRMIIVEYLDPNVSIN